MKNNGNDGIDGLLPSGEPEEVPEAEHGEVIDFADVLQGQPPEVKPAAKTKAAPDTVQPSVHRQDLDPQDSMKWVGAKPIDTQDVLSRRWMSEKEFREFWVRQGLVFRLMAYYRNLVGNGLTYNSPDRFLEEMRQMLEDFLVKGSWLANPKKLNKPTRKDWWKL